jgi:flagellar protein FliO/FliZ
MFDTLFGAEMPLAVRFFLAFLIVLGLIGATAWAVRRFGAGRLGAGTRGRQPRLAVIDYASVDGRRRLILVRRDNVEHLLMIGGPTDVVVEPNIVRAVAAPRDVPVARPTAGLDVLPRAIPLPENSNGSWPLAPESTVGLRPSPRLESLPDELPSRPFQPLVEPPARPPRDTLSALADELTVRPTPPTPPRKPVESRQEIRQEARQEPRVEPRPEPRVELRKPIAQPAAAPSVAPAPDAAEPAATADQSLADMAQRLEAALRKPNADTTAPATPARAASADTAPSAPPQPRTGRPNEMKPSRPDAKPAQGAQGKTALYDSLEQEMASLLGRPTKP